MSATTPTTVRKTVLSLTAVRSLMSLGRYMRRPIGSWSGQKRRASLWSTITTPSASALSWSEKKRPSTSLAPIASK